MNTFESCAFQGCEVDLHAGAYLNCTFARCELIFDGRPIRLENPTIIECGWRFRGPAATTVAFLRELCASDPNVKHAIMLELGLVHVYAN